MTKEEKLKEAAKAFASKFVRGTKGRMEQIFIDIATSQATKEYHQREWTPVSEGLPEYLKDVLVECEDSVVRILSLEDWESGDEISGYESGDNWTDERGNEWQINQTVKWAYI